MPPAWRRWTSSRACRARTAGSTSSFFDDEGVELTAVAYFANKTGEFAPGRDYLGLIITGSRDHKLPDEYVQALESIRTHA